MGKISVYVYRFNVICLLADHLSGKPGNVTEFDSCQGNVRDFAKVWEMSGKKSCQGKVA